jgi:hypothetical protein
MDQPTGHFLCQKSIGKSSPLFYAKLQLCWLGGRCSRALFHASDRAAATDTLEGAEEILRYQLGVYVEIHPGLVPRFGKSPMDVFQFFDFDKYYCFANYPGKEPLSRYRKEFELTEPCALFFVPRNRPPVVRYYAMG